MKKLHQETRREGEEGRGGGGGEGRGGERGEERGGEGSGGKQLER